MILRDSLRIFIIESSLLHNSSANPPPEAANPSTITERGEEEKINKIQQQIRTKKQQIRTKKPQNRIKTKSVPRTTKNQQIRAKNITKQQAQIRSKSHVKEKRRKEGIFLIRKKAKLSPLLYNTPQVGNNSSIPLSSFLNSKISESLKLDLLRLGLFLKKLSSDS